MAAAKKDRVGMQRRADVESARTFRPVKFVRANGNEVSVELLDACERLFAQPLNSVSVEKNPSLATERANFRDWLQRADFIVCGHDRDENRVWTQRGTNGLDADATYTDHIEQYHGKLQEERRRDRHR